MAKATFVGGHFFQKVFHRQTGEDLAVYHSISSRRIVQLSGIDAFERTKQSIGSNLLPQAPFAMLR